MQFEKQTNTPSVPVVQSSPMVGQVTMQTSEVITADVVRNNSEMALAQTTTSLATTRDNIKAMIIASGEAQQLSDKLSVHNAQSIVEFGKPAAEAMSKCADGILRRQDMNTINQTTTLMGVLNKIMDKVDIGEIKDLDKDPGFFDRIFNSAQRKLDNMIAKYNNVGTEIEKVCVELRTYESAIEQSNRDLEQLYDSGIESYLTLRQYTIAGEYALEEVAAYKKDLEGRAAVDPQAALELSNA